MKFKRIICMIIVVADLLFLASCRFIPAGLTETNDNTETGFWIRNESYFVDYTIKGDKIQFRYSFCFQNLSDYDMILYAFSATFRKRDLKGWLKYEKGIEGVLDNGEDKVLLPTGQKMNVVLVFEGEYLGGEVNEDVFIKHIGMCQRIQ